VRLHRTCCILAALLLTDVVDALAAAAPVTMADDAMIETAELTRVSLGAGVEMIGRDVTISRTVNGNLDGLAYYGYLGLDLTDWLTLFGTAGSVTLNSLDGSGLPDNFSSDLRWSGGINASLWHVNVIDPGIMRGRFSIGLVVEYSDYAASVGNSDVAWTDFAVSLPVGYEIPNDPMAFAGVESLYLFAGPIYSVIDGDYGIADSKTAFEFEQAHDMGVAGGFELYLAPTVSLGAQLQLIDDLSMSASARFHF
jgi:hypothetical protein